jgi:hypothetical protein
VDESERRSKAAPPPQRQPSRSAAGGERATMIPSRGRRRLGVERVAMRVVATGGIVGIGVVLGAVLVSQDVAGWIVGLVVALTSVVLAAVLWSSRQL